MPPIDEYDPSTTDVDEILAHLASHIDNGLSTQEAAQRLARDGPNELMPAAPVPAWQRLLSQFQNPVVYLLLAAVVIALAAWIVEGLAGWPVDAIVIAVILALNAVFAYLQEAKAQNAVAALARMTTVNSAVRRNGKQVRIPSVELVVGDILVLGEGDEIGADARLVQATSLRTIEASLTGESEPVLKDPRTLSRQFSVGERHNMIFKGTQVAQGTGLAVVSATGMTTEVGAIATLLEATAEQPTPLQKEVSQLGMRLTLAVLLIASIVMASVFFSRAGQAGADVVSILLLGISLAVAAVPEGLPAVLSVVLALGVHRMARQNAIVKKLSSVETLGSTSVICTDKTGTLTRSEMTIQRIATASGTAWVTGVGYAPDGQIQHEGHTLNSGPLYAEQIALLGAGTLASNARLDQNSAGDWQIDGDPSEAAFLVAERKLGTHERRARRFTRIGEVPFTSERMMMSALVLDHEHDDLTVIVTKGAPDVLLNRCNRLRVGMDTVTLNDEYRGQILSNVNTLSDAALRTLAVAYRPLEPGEEPIADETLERQLIFLGTAGMIDPPRPEVAPAIELAHRAGIRIIMVTGDHPRTAARIAQDLSIMQAGAAVATGDELKSVDDPTFTRIVRETSVFARVSPADKLRIVRALQADGNIVAMTGDGVNDAPALKSADIGIAMGITGNDVSRQAAKMILADDNFATIVQAVRQGRGIFENIRKFLRYLLSSNLGEVLTVFLGVVGAKLIGLSDGAIALPLLATQILWINLVTDSGPALAMGVDPQTSEVMTRKPRRLTERFIDAEMWSWSILTGLVMAIVTLLTIDLYLPQGLIEGKDSLDTARTAGFTVLVLCQLFNCFNARSATASAFSQLFDNGWLWGAVGLSVLLQIAVVNLDLLNTAFHTVPLSLDQWAVCAAMASIVLCFGELRKLVIRWRRNDIK